MCKKSDFLYVIFYCRYRRFGQKISSQRVCLVSFIYSSNNSSYLIALLSHSSSVHSSHQNRNICYTVERTSLFPVDKNPCPVLPNVTSQMCPPHHHSDICGRQDFTSARQTDVPLLALNPRNAVTVNAGIH
jgi:hypothetical protein